MAKQRAPALPDSLSFQQLWDALGSRLIEATQERLLYTQGVRGCESSTAHHRTSPDSHIYHLLPPHLLMV